MKFNWEKILTIVSLIFGILGTTGVGLLTKFEEDQHQKRVKEIEAIFVNPDTKEPTAFTNRYMINPIINKAKENIEEAFKDTAKTQILAAAMQLDVNELKSNNEKALTIFKGLDSLGLTPQDVVNKYAESLKVTEGNPCVTMRGMYTMNTCEGIYTHRFTPDLGWRELYNSIPPGNDWLLEAVYWYNDKKGHPIIDRSISHVVSKK